jgi:hypothetical protein
MSGCFRLGYVQSYLARLVYVKLGRVSSAYNRICQVMPGKESIAQLVIRLRHVMSGFAKLVRLF